MSGFCGSPIFDYQLWNHSSYPDLSPCLQLVGGNIFPPVFLGVISTCRFYHLYHSKKQGLAHHWLSSIQTILSLCLCIPPLADLFRTSHDLSVGVEMFPVDYMGPIFLTLGMILSAVIVQYERKKSGRYFGGLFAYWLMLGCFDVFILYSKILRAVTKGYIDDEFRMATFVIHFGLVLTQLAFSFVPTPSLDHHNKNSSPELTANYVSRITFWWFTGLMVRGYKKPLEEADLWTLSDVDKVATWVAPFEREWKKEMDKCKCYGPRTTVSITKANEDQAQPGKETLQLLEDHERDAPAVHPKSEKVPSLTKCLVKVFWPTVLMGACFKLFHDSVLFLNPILLKAIIKFTKDPSEPSWRGYMYAFMMFVVALSLTTLLHQYFFKAMLVGLRLRSTICAAVYNKALKLTSASRKESTVGEIVNLMSVDAQRFMDIMTYLNMIWSAPLQIIVSLVMLWQILGASVLAGMGVMILMIPLNLFVANRVKILQVAQMKEKDQRVKLMNEMLNGMKVLKLYAWEPSFNKIISDVRERELALLRKSGYLNAFTTFFWNTAPFLVACTTFATYILSNPDNVLDAEKAFMSLSLFNIMRFPMSMLPNVVSQMIEVSVSVKRLTKFLSLGEMNVDQVDRRPNPELAVEVTNGSFTWKDGLEESPTLDSINLTVKPGQLVAVVGVVGSGKSSLISALLGDMRKVNGRVAVSGSVAYVPQQAWIQNASLKDNILFGYGMKETDYDRIIDACALRPDLAMLPAGENTEIGEKGINLSGGQKQRVSLARAVYSGADTYLLDDPLSAVDSHVGKHIFDQVIGPNGCLSGKTRILVTHGISFLPQMDHIVVLKDGRISEVGAFDELIKHAGAFAEFLKQYFLDVRQEAESNNLSVEDVGLKEKLLTQVSQVLNEDVRELRRQLSEADEVRERLASVGARSSKSITDKLHRSQQDLAEKMSLRSHKSQLSLHESHPALSREIVGEVDQADIDIHAALADISEKEVTDEKVVPVKVDKAKEKLIEKESTEKGRVKLAVFKAYMAAVSWFVSIAIILCYIVEQCLSISANFWLSKWSDDIKTATNNVSHTKEEYLGVYAGLGLGQGVLSLVAALMMATGSRLASRSLHFSLLDNILHCPMMFFDTTPSGRILNRFTKDVSVVDGVIPMVVRGFIYTVLAVLSTLVVICVSTPWFILVIIPLSILYFFVQRFYVETSRQLKRIESVALSPIYSHFDETVQGVVTIRAFNRQGEFMRQSLAKIDAHQKAYYPTIIANRWLAVRLEFVGTCITLGAVIMAVISRNSGTSTLTAGLVGLSITYALNITNTLNWMVRMTSELETNIVAVERIKEYAEVAREADWINPNNRPRPNWPDKGDLVFDNYSVRYREGLDLVLKGITCNIKGGEKVGIVGRTGAGKSSLTLALFRILEAADGAIFLDDIRIGSLGLHDLRKALTIIPQDPVLFSGTLRMNLDPFDQYSDDNLWKAVEMAHLKTFVSSLAEGLQYKCSEGGANLSVGQRQLVCLARALLRHTKVLILDEATAAVDLETDDLIQSTIRTAFADSTVLTIAHRLNTIMDYDRIMVLDAGSIKEFSAPGDLLQDRGSAFYSMAKDANLI